MGTIFVDNIKQQSSQGSGTITIGASGETVALGSGVTPSGNFGNLVHIKTITLASNTKPIQFLNSDADVTFDSTYKTYKFIGNVAYENDNRVTYIRVSNDGTNLDTGSNYLFDSIGTLDDSVTGVNDASSSVWQLDNSDNNGNAANEHVSFEMTIFNSTFNYTRMISTFLGSQPDGGSALALRGGRYNVNSTVQGISFFPNSTI